jgi:glycosyltransferase involved in cell wall biosynthesis
VKPKALIICSETPYPHVVGGYERMIRDFEQHVFDDYDVYFLNCRARTPRGLFHEGLPLDVPLDLDTLLAYDFRFALIIRSDIDLEAPRHIAPLIANIPTFCFVERHPHRLVRDHRFNGILTHRTARSHDNVLTIGGGYDPAIFHPRRRPSPNNEPFVLSVGRIHPRKNQLELVRDFRKRIYDRFGIPLLLVGGEAHHRYYRDVLRHIDGVAVRATFSAEQDGWKTAPEIADLCNRARYFVMPSPRETFCIALIEALACGTTAIVNGYYGGFAYDDLRPNVIGPISGKRGSILDVLEKAIAADVRIDASAWATKFALQATKRTVMGFIGPRLPAFGAALPNSA